MGLDASLGPGHSPPVPQDQAGGQLCSGAAGVGGILYPIQSIMSPTIKFLPSSLCHCLNVCHGT